jgi:hypothetical protein
MSGDMNTSLGNVLLMCLMCHSYFREIGLDCAFLNDGDDCVVICERRDLPKLNTLPDWFSKLGMVMKVEPAVDELERVEFCQSHPVEINPGYWRMVRDPRVTLSKDLCVTRPVRDERTWNMMRKSISDCGMALAGDVPVYFAFYSALGREATVSKRSARKMRARGPSTGMEFLARGMHPKYQWPSTCCRVSFAKAFDIWPDQQEAMERQYHPLVPKWRDPECVPGVVNLFYLMD